MNDATWPAVSEAEKTRGARHKTSINLEKMSTPD
eukprot:CAMPEP_0172870088 /NCGR_PEP_ID=MMETSP1075-20121228/90939_1 /TAXON_ID=2916 /ORGANISM="Ceratium fusus, Strain PA161109" /LENGTH=33 /DNA_ID= /DNA_START= /DNA_END= /DNA_ORIENTATION=